METVKSPVSITPETAPSPTPSLSKENLSQSSNADNEDYHRDDDDASVSVLDSEDTDEELTPSSDERDEVKEVEKMSRSDTKKVNVLRIATTVVLLLTAFAVTYTTYSFLKAEEQESFETAFDQFSRTITGAVTDQQTRLRDGMKTLATIMSNYARENEAEGVEWPRVTLPRFEDYAANVRKQGGIELLTIAMKVMKDKRGEYESHANFYTKQWVQEGHMIQKGSLERLVDIDGNETYYPYITMKTPDGLVKDEERDFYWPSYQYSTPPSKYGLINMNLFAIDDYGSAITAMMELKNETTVTRVRKYIGVPIALSQEEHDALHSELADSNAEHPHSMAFYPIHKDTDDYESEIVAAVLVGFAWDSALRFLLPHGVHSIHAIVKNDCNQSYTYNLDGQDAFFLGEGDYHEEKFHDMEVVVNLSPFSHPDFTSTTGHCQYKMHIYPTDTFKASYDSNTPEIFATVVAITFVLVAVVFYFYDVFVQKRNRHLVAKAAQTSAIVTSLFPEHMKERLINERERAQAAKKKGNLKSYLHESQSADGVEAASRPMADLYLETTVIFSDIVGFTAWSSVREPTAVFTLLESLYQAFDKIAKKRRVFKVETVGDCYVAVCGLPNPRKDHAIACARFGRDILAKMHVLTKELEVTLGPDTSELQLRIGLHSGQVTAGILRGERARFQLFGDTMNTCSRLESSGKPGRIHCSKETAELIKAGGKGAWLEKRSDRPVMKGKGVMESYWVSADGGVASSTASSTALEAAGTYKSKLPGLDEKTNRLISWNVETLLGLLKSVVAYRRAKNKRFSLSDGSAASKYELQLGETPLEEVQEIIKLPAFDEKVAKAMEDVEQAEIPAEVVDQLHHLVSTICFMYRDNPFHNFEHASHVVMSVIKLMSRIVAPAGLEDMDDANKAAASLHDHTYGITSSPLTQFACAFSALIHDIDHVGVSNAQLVKEEVPIAAKYHGRSVAEQNSLDLAWDLLMQPRYYALQAALFPTQDELVRFRQLVVNSVIATDIVDKDNKALRNQRWDKAFKKGDVANHVAENKRDEINRKATIVIEHIIQASDISHTMQHWHVYRKWNQNLFEELYVAYLNGRMDKNPSAFWVKGELGFFDFYIIPLTKKLKECGVFGVSSDEYLNYALSNREEWEARGEDVVASLVAACEKKFGVKSLEATDK